MMRVAFLGLGTMGLPMAANIARAGHDLVLWNRSPKQMNGFGSRKPAVADSPGEALRGADVAVTMLADDQAVHDVVLRVGLLDALPSGAVHVSMSSIGIATVRHLTEMHAAKHQPFVSAPVLGRPDMAESAKLWAIAAGADGAVARVRPLLKAVGRGVTVVGEKPWHANLVKLANNLMAGGMMEAFGEMYALMRKAGIPPQVFLETANALFQSPTSATQPESAARARQERISFRPPLGLDDLRALLATAQEFSVPSGDGGFAHGESNSGVGLGAAGTDWGVLAPDAPRRAGLA